MNPSTVVIGIGNEIRGDDAVGLVALRRIAEQSSKAPLTSASDLLIFDSSARNTLGSLSRSTSRWMKDPY